MFLRIVNVYMLMLQQVGLTYSQLWQPLTMTPEHEWNMCCSLADSCFSNGVFPNDAARTVLGLH